ncbi:unnamed protein product, partial [Mycena citricolor]
PCAPPSLSSPVITLNGIPGDHQSSGRTGGEPGRGGLLAGRAGRARAGPGGGTSPPTHRARRVASVPLCMPPSLTCDGRSTTDTIP